MQVRQAVLGELHLLTHLDFLKELLVLFLRVLRGLHWSRSACRSGGSGRRLRSLEGVLLVDVGEARFWLLLWECLALAQLLVKHQFLLVRFLPHVLPLHIQISQLIVVEIEILAAHYRVEVKLEVLG